MQRRLHIRSKREIIERAKERRIVVEFAKNASSNAKRSSKALEISYDIIKNGAIFKIFENGMIKTANLKKIDSNRSNLKKGSVICLE
nr:hypothetical protein [uncultured Chryseobacterium sp.]